MATRLDLCEERERIADHLRVVLAHERTNVRSSEREADISSERQARYQRRMSSLLAGRA